MGFSSWAMKVLSSGGSDILADKGSRKETVALRKNITQDNSGLASKVSLPAQKLI